MLVAELTHHLHAEAKQGPTKAGNHRNGSSAKTVITPSGELELDILRDRLATFEPRLLAKYQRRLPGFDDHVISTYARGTGAEFRAACGELQAHKGLQLAARGGARDPGAFARAVQPARLA